jgi:hypothetical protein
MTELVPQTNNGTTTVTATNWVNALPGPNNTVGLGIPWGIAIDGYTNSATGDPFTIWVTDNGNNVLSEFLPVSVPGFAFNSPQNSGGLSTPAGVAVDGPENVWVANPDGQGGIYGNCISEFYGLAGGGLLSTNVTAGEPYQGSPFAVGIMPEKIAIDPSGVVWTANYGGQEMTAANASVSQYNNTNSPIVEQNFTQGGITGTYGGPYSIAVDGGGNIWVANYGPAEVPYTGSITELDNNGSPFSPANGYQPGLDKADSIAIDASGNVWVVNNGAGTVTELVGAATPVSVPLSNTTVGDLP